VTLSIQEISDRLEIQDLLVAYSHAIDFHDWDALDHVFTPDAVIDYTEMGAPQGTLAETKAFLAQVLPTFASYQHMVATSQVTIDGDVAHGRTLCHNPMVFRDGEGKETVMFCGLWYRDTFVRTDVGWRIKDRYEERCYLINTLLTS
jgi:SnoaL-like domain